MRLWPARVTVPSGRTSWEGYTTATRAAAAGGITTIVDMPLNSIPSTTTLDAFRTKLDAAKNQCFVDVAFWGGIVPGNAEELKPMLNAGVVGFKCFLIHSGVDDFPHVEQADLETALKTLQGTDATVLFHAEMDCACNGSKGNPEEYRTFLESRPAVMEEKAIDLVCEMCLKYKVKCHIVHLSAASALPSIVAAKEKGAPLTVETCHHYLSLNAETVPNGNTLYKCCPPIREKKNQDLLWDGLKKGYIDMVVSDHSPCTPDLKLLDKGDFMAAWGGVASVQFGLSLFWTNCRNYGMNLFDMVKLMCENTAKLASLSHRKGAIRAGYDADFVIWDPDVPFEVSKCFITHNVLFYIYPSSLAKGFRSTLLPINPWRISLRKLGDVVALSSEQFELRPLHIYILIELTNRYYTHYGINTT
uniref:allantoinase n=1 Tax=Magallana gigas TaxID=29159 RepID=K1R1D5_MAGGI